MAAKIHPIYCGRIIQLNLEQAVLPDGRQIELEIVHHPGGVAILAEDAQARLCVIRQYRHAAGGWLWEFPAGKLEVDEPPERTARRELLEEAGVEAAHWRKLGQTVTSPGVLTEVIHLYHASGLRMQTHAHEADELIEIHWFDLATIEQMVRSGEITDAKTLVGLYLWKSTTART